MAARALHRNAAPAAFTVPSGNISPACLQSVPTAAIPFQPSKIKVAHLMPERKPVMDNKIEIFKNEQFGEVRTILIGDEPWFAGKDVALVLRYSNPQKAIRDHVDEEDRTVNESFTVHGTPITLINESGLYSLIMCSKLPEAKAFKRWITHEVIPTIRKTGGYMTDSLLERIQKEPAVIVEFAQALILEKNRVKALECELNTAKPKADYYDAFINPDDCTNIRTTAKELKSRSASSSSFFSGRSTCSDLPPVSFFPTTRTAMPDCSSSAIL